MKKNSEYLERNTRYISYMKDVFRKQRHDYMNYFQIIYGYLQLGKTEEAIGQIKKIIQLNSNISQIYKLSLFHISIFLDNVIKEMEDLEYIVDIDVINNTKNTISFFDNEEKIIENLDLIFTYFLEQDIESKKNIGIKIEEFEDRISFIFCGENKISTLIKINENVKIIEDNGRINVVFKLKNYI